LQGEISFKPLGRDFCGLPSPDSDEWLLTPAQIFELVDLLPDIARTKLFRDSDQIPDENDLGHPRYRVKTQYQNVELPKAVIEIELKENCATPQRGAVRKDIEEHLIRLSPELAEFIAMNRIEFKVQIEDHVQPGVISYAP
jgi:hypothetical protein